MLPRDSIGNASDPHLVALLALGWLCQDEDRAERLLAITGLEPGTLRETAGLPDTQAAVLGFLANHEPDLIACAQAIAVAPEELMAAHRALSGPEWDA
ncbi:DUF3572 domain-containing protein [Sphingobium subterraneum]|uniref:DUF3572 domain-containing protein n=1 Tax=Sphingobium subterraneum TaxID=627688 RepID=A0A841J3N4_9SPHN|nr:DUF3572 domain-containing protein [Sphingobium subterraneum]MBB6124942.1 hypothetical protein [Sphingobium subterraneum]